MVTTEFAVTMLAVIPVVLSLIVLVLVGAEQVRLTDAARTGARMIARGQDHDEVVQMVERTLPAAGVDVERRGDDVAVTVRRRIDPVGLLPALTLRAQAVTPAEVPDAR